MIKSMYLAPISMMGLCSLAFALDAPPQLRGRSVELDWSEYWVTQTPGGGGRFTNTNVNKVIFYFSERGRIFQRRSVDETYSRNSYKVDAVGKERSASKVTDFNQISFPNHNMVAGRNIGADVAVRFILEFGPSYSTCNATMTKSTTGKASPVFLAPDGATREILDIQPLNARCKLTEGNLLQ